MKKFTLDIPIIPVKLHLIITKDIINERMKMVYEFGPVNTNAQMLADALCSYGNTGHFGLFFSPHANKGVISHEIFHVVNRIMDFIGCKLCYESEEFYAYLNETITNWVYFKMEKK